MTNKLSVSMTRYEQLAGWIYLVLQLSVLSLVLRAVNLLLGQSFSLSELNFIFFCVNFLCVTVIFRRFLIRSVRVTLSSPGRWASAVAWGLGLYWAMQFMVSLIITRLYPEFFNVNDTSVATMVLERPVLITLGTVLLVPVAEEVLYRGLIFRSLYNRHPILGYAVSTLAFAALHVVGYLFNYTPLHLALCFLQYIPAGLCLGWAYARADSILAPIAIHMVINLIGILAVR